MKRSLFLFLLLALPSGAESILYAGVLGNSGGEGRSLVRFSDKTAAGMGVAYDRLGSLWDRGGEGRLNRYAADGRFLGSYPLPAGGTTADKDTLLLIGDTLLLKVGKRLHSLKIDAEPGTALTLLSPEANRLSLGTNQGWAAAANGKEVFLVNPAGDTKPVATFENDVEDLELGPGDGVYVQSRNQLYRVDRFASADGKGPWPAPGDRPQWLVDHWLGSAWHGTLRRFDGSLLPDPGVVLGGASGSFIGYVEGNHELNHCRGLARLHGNLFAASGLYGVMHLLEWQPLESRFTIVRRIGAVQRCSGLALDGKHRIWFDSGFWEWNDGPETPLHHSVPPPDAPGTAGAANMPGGAIVAPGIRWGKNVLYYGTGPGPVGLSDDVPLPEKAVASAVITLERRPLLLVVDARGKGVELSVGSEGNFEKGSKALELPTSVPLVELTSLSGEGDKLYGTDQGQVIEWAREGGSWRETKRWNSWGGNSDQKFGASIMISCGGGRLWISDTARHRVLCFDAVSRTLVGVFGAPDQAGDDHARLSAPRTLSVRDRRAVVFDSGNQRLVRMELKE